MNKFLKNILSSCLGSLLALTVIILVSIIIISSYTSKSKPNQKGVLHINVNGAIPDFQSNEFNLSNLNLEGPNLYLWDLRKKILAAAADQNIKGIYLEFNDALLSQETAIEIADYLKQFRKSGKKIFSYSYYYDQNAYLLSSYSDSIFLNPNGEIDLKGYSIYAPFFNTLLDKLDIDINIYYAGKYKSSTEPYRLNQFSEDNRFQFKIYLDQLKNILIQEILANRSVTEDSLLKILEGSEFYDAQNLLQAHLVDDLIYMNEFEDILKKEFGTDELVKFTSYKVSEANTKNSKTALVFAEGEILWDSNSGGINHAQLVKSFEKIKENKDIETVVLRINSPGGSGYASDLIYHEIEQLKQSGKNVYASLGEVAASGGYYIASACDSIFANENTLTGSIGVYIMLPTFDNFLKNKLEVNVDSITSNKNAIGYSPLLSINEVENKKLIHLTDKLYHLFLDRVSKGRGISSDSIHTLAQGRIWTGKDAKTIGLIDGIKSLDELLLTLNVEKNNIKVYPEGEQNILNELMDSGIADFSISEQTELNFLNNQLTELNNLLKKPLPMMRLPTGIFVTKQ